MLVLLEGVHRKGVPCPTPRPSGAPGVTASRGGRLPVRADARRAAPRCPEEEGVELRRRTADARAMGFSGHTPVRAGAETVMVGFLVGAQVGNDSHATQGPGRWARRHGGQGPTVNHSCDPNCAFASTTGRPLTSMPAVADPRRQELDVRLRHAQLHDRPLPGRACVAPRCRGSVTGWKLTCPPRARPRELRR